VIASFWAESFVDRCPTAMRGGYREQRHHALPNASTALVHVVIGLAHTCRIMRKIATNETEGLVDTSTFADPALVSDLIDNRV
jgi:hypothetical protein